MSVTKLEVAGIDLELFDSGSGAPLLFLHGAGGFAPNHPYVAPLSAKHRLIAPSHPGFGASDLPDWLDRPDDIAHIHLELLDRLKLKEVDMIGCSVGGWIAAEMASMAPERFKRLVMVGPVGIKVGPADKLDIPDIFAMSAADVAKITHHDPAKMTPDMSKMADEQMAVMFRNRETLALLVWEPWMHNPKLKHWLHRIACPALFIRGASDGLVSDAYMQAYAKLLPNARTMTVPDAGHVPHIERTEAFASAVLKFLGD